MDNNTEHQHYFKNVDHIMRLDVYRVLRLFPTGSAAIDHAVKKLLVPGSRGSKNRVTDVKEAIDSLLRELAIMGEDANGGGDREQLQALKVAISKLDEKTQALHAFAIAGFSPAPPAAPAPRNPAPSPQDYNHRK